MPATLRRGSRGPDVTRLQTILNSRLRPSPNLRPDGAFGPQTETAVRNFQAMSRLGVDGIVGPRTWAALEVGTGGVAPSTPPVISKAGDTSWMTVARQEAGQSEIPGRQHNSRILQYHATTTLRAASDEVAWCSSFVNWCLKQAGITGTNSAAAASWLNWGHSTTARGGAITVIYNQAAANSRLSRSGNHVAFLIQESATHYVLLGGNQGDQVRISSYPKSRWQLKGYRWPNH